MRTWLIWGKQICEAGGKRNSKTDMICLDEENNKFLFYKVKTVVCLIERQHVQKAKTIIQQK